MGSANHDIISTSPTNGLPLSAAIVAFTQTQTNIDTFYHIMQHGHIYVGLVVGLEFILALMISFI